MNKNTEQGQNCSLDDNIVSQNPEEEGISLRELLYIFRTRLLLIFSFIIAALVLAWFYLQYTVPIYEAKATALVEPLQNSTSLESLMGADTGSSKISTEVELVKSRRTIKAALDKLNLDNYLNSEEIPYSKLRNSYLSYSAIQQRMVVSTVKDTNMMSITVSDQNPKFAADLADSLMSAYTELLTGIAKNSKSAQREFIEAQIPLNEEAMKEANRKLAEYRQESGVIQMTEKSSILTRQIAFYQMKMEPLLFQQVESEGRLSQYESLYSDRDVPSVDDLKADEQVSSNLKLYRDANIELLLYESLIFEENNTKDDEPRLHVLENNMSLASKNILNAVSSILSPSLDKGDISDYSKILTDTLIVGVQLNVLEEMEDRYDEELSRYPELERTQLELQRDVEIYEALNIKLREMLEETKLIEAAVVGNVNIVDGAVLPTSPVSPNRTMVMAVAFLLGLAGGFLVALLLEMTDYSIHNEDTIKKIIGPDIHSLGWIPYVDPIRFRDKTKEGIKGLLVLNDPDSQESERYKMVANNILYSCPEKVQVMQVNSTTMGEGKSFLISNIATFYAMVGKRVIILDGDLRRPSIERFFNLKRSKKGIVDAIVDDAPLEECIIQPMEKIKNLHILPSGKISRNPVAIYSSGKYRRLIGKLREEYDIILIDAPPASYAAESASISNAVDGVVINIRAGVATKGGLRDLVQSFRFCRCNILGYVYYGVIASEHNKRYSGQKYSYNYGESYYYYSGKKNNMRKMHWSKRKYRTTYKRELKERRKEKTYGEREPMLAYSKIGTFGSGKIRDNFEKAPDVVQKSTMDFLSEIEADFSAKGRHT